MNTNNPYANKERSTSEGAVLSQKEHQDGSDVPEAKVDGFDVGALEGIDGIVETTGEVSEAGRETKDSSPAGTGTRPAQAQAGGQGHDLAYIRQQLLQHLPPEKHMRTEIEKEINKEIRYLHKKAMNMMRKPGKVNFFEMNNVLMKIRELKGVLAKLVKASMEGLKTLWLRYVHGIM